jgi:hypothetical protein
VHQSKVKVDLASVAIGLLVLCDAAPVSALVPRAVVALLGCSAAMRVSSLDW